MYYYKLSIWCISYDILNLTFQSGIPNVNQGSFYFMIKMVHVFEVMVEGLPDPTLRTYYHIFFEENLLGAWHVIIVREYPSGVWMSW